MLREATRRVGVSANAAYRHFADRDDLLDDVVSLAQGRAADVIEQAIAEVDDGRDPGHRHGPGSAPSESATCVSP